MFLWRRWHNRQIDTLDRAMGSYVKPGIKLGLHDMAGSTEKRRLRFGQQPGWAETQKQPPSSNQHKYPHKKLPPFLLPCSHVLEPHQDRCCRTVFWGWHL